MTSLTLQQVLEDAQAGNARAQYNVGAMYAHGNGVEANPKQTHFWFAKAAEYADFLKV